MGCHVAKYWVAGSSCAPLVDETAEEESEDRWQCCCRLLWFHRHESRNMEVSIEPSDWSQSHVDLRSPEGRNVHVGFPVIEEESPKSTSSRFRPGSLGSLDASPRSNGHVVPAPLKGLVDSIAAELGLKGSLEVAGLPLDEFWRKLLTLETKGLKSAFARAEKLLQFRRRFFWPLSISAHHVEKALRSGANVYLPPRCVGDSPFVIFTAQKVDTSLCTMEEYQMLIMFMLETAFRDSYPDQDRGVILVLDVRHLSSVVWQAFISGLSDMRRGVAMCSAALPMKASHVQLIQDEAGARLAHFSVGLALSKLSGKMRSRVNRGGPEAALEALGKETLPDFLGGQRDSVLEFSGWLEQLQVADPSQIAASACVASAPR